MLDELCASQPEHATELRRRVRALVERGLWRPAAGDEGPREIGDFRILESLGQGGMGVVFLAEQKSVGRRVALKLLPREAAGDPEAIARFHKEARTTSSLNHPHICTVLDFGTADGRPFIAMELVEGRTLAALLVPGRPALSHVGAIAQVAQALAAAHAAGVVHRDVKPANIMLRDDGYAKVLDFGIARLARPEHGGGGSARTGRESGALVGTPWYMSPEQARAEVAGPASDVYSLGLVLYELATGRHAFEAGSVVASLVARHQDDAPAPRTANPEIDPALDALILRMLDRTPESRPEMSEVAAELERIAHVATPARRAPTAPTIPGHNRARIRSRAWLAVIPVVVFGLAMVWIATRGLVPVSRRDPQPPSTPAGSASGVTSPPSIAVLPFTTAGDPANAYFSAGVTEDIVSMLARAPDLSVRFHGAAASDAGAPLDEQRIGRELGVGYVLTGSVRKDAQQVRITARLVEVRTGADVWAERLDRTGSDPWALQDEIAGRIVGALTGEYGQIKRAQYRATWGTDSTHLVEYDYYLRGHELYMRLTPQDNERAGEVWRSGLAVFPDSALLLAKLGFYHFMRPYLYLGDTADVDYARAGELVRRALAHPHLSPLESRLAHWLNAYVSAQEGDWPRAFREMETTRALAPYDAFQTGDLATIPILACQTSDALRMLETALRADPANRSYYQQLRGWALAVGGRHAESVAALDEAIELPAVRLLQAINYVRLGRHDEARAAVARARTLQPQLNRDRWRQANFYRDRSVLDAQLADLASAGLP
ncbi:MAG: protein kinase [Planctomycetaceae bacterium]|nr:protein kinase [Planctomycetaceae bacterium]